MKTISNVDLEKVTGGKANPITGNSGSSSSGGGGNDQLLSTLQGIQSSLKDLQSNQNKGLFSGNNGLLFMTMAFAMSRRNEVYVQYGGGCRRGIYWRSSW